MAISDGEVVLVRGGLPGELAECKETGKVRGVRRAEVMKVVEAHAERRIAPCPYYGVCGGCQLQHAGPDLQVRLKIEVLRETLRRAGEIEWSEAIPLTRSPELGYRGRARLRTSQKGGARCIGFYRHSSHEIVPIDRCLLLTDALNQVLPDLAAWVGTRAGRKVQSIDLLEDSGGSVHIRLNGKCDSCAAARLTELKWCASVWIAADETTAPSLIAGSSCAEVRAGTHTYFCIPGGFFQSNVHIRPAMIDALTRQLPTAGRLAIDLHAGVGFFTLPLAGRFNEVIAADRDEQSLRMARLAIDHARKHGLVSGKVSLVSADAAAAIENRPAREQPDVIVLDPPRQGLSAALISGLGSHRPERLIYFSCEPATFARDLRRLIDLGYSLKLLEAFDQFPQTHDLEVMATLE